jgi:hypothetical protein
MKQEPESTEKNAAPQSSTGENPIIQGLIWGAVIAIWGVVFGLLARVFSQNPVIPSPPDTLHGQSTLADMHKYVEGVLAAAPDALIHDQSLINTIGIAVVALCTLAFAAACFIVVKARKPQAHSGGLRCIAVCGLALAPFALTSVTKLHENRLLHGASILTQIGNSNIRPPIITPGQNLTIELQTSFQSVRGYYESEGFTIQRSEAELPDGTIIPINLAGAEIKSDNPNDKPGTTDLILEMENLTLPLNTALPNNPKLTDALVRVSVSGHIGLIPSGQRQVSHDNPFVATTSFRVAGDRENQFYADCSRLTTRHKYYVIASLITAVIIISVIIVFGKPPVATPKLQTRTESDPSKNA